MMWANPSLVQYLWDGLMIGVCLVDHEGTVAQMNPAGSRLLGWGAVCPAQVSFYDLFDGLEPAEAEMANGHALLAMLKEKKIVWFPRVRLRCRQGSRCWVELKGVVVEDSEATQFLLMFRDLDSEMQLAKEFGRLASIPEENPFPVIEVDAAGHLLYANPSMVHLMEEAQIGQDGFTTALPDQFPDLASRCLAQGHLETNIEVQVGEKHYAWSFSPHPELGRLRGYGMDITESKRAAAELSAFADMVETKNQELDQALIKAEAATRAKAAFLATMSHEIRTPLNGVIGMAELLMNSSLNLEQQECTQIIRKSGEGLLAIINDILDFSKIESGHMALETIGFDPMLLVEEAVDLFSERAYQKGLDLAAYVAPDIPRHLLGDPYRLRQILCNFISNALKFTSHGSILIEVTLLAIDRSDIPAGSSEGRAVSESVSEDSVGFVRFMVKDTGIGISQPIQRKIFQVFTQADSSMSRKFGGSGLGLAICKQLAELMNGTVGVESQIGKGSTFWCDLPFHLPVFATDTPVKQSIGVNKDILVCSSLDVSIEVLSRYLKEIGIRVMRVEQVQEALAFFEDKAASPSEVLGIIMGREANDEAWMSWLKAARASPFSKLKIWCLAPFWLRKGIVDHPFAFDGMITMPIHRDRLFRCVFHKPDVAASADLKDAQEIQEAQDFVLEDNHRGNCLVTKDLNQPEKLGPSILIVEDNIVNQKVAAGLFDKLGCQVYIAESGIQALSLVREHAIDVIMMDWELPGMDGFETACAIRELEKTNRLEPRRRMSKIQDETGFSSCAHLPIVGMTAHGLSEQNHHRWVGVMDDCLAKPVRLRDLANVLERWVGFDVHAMGHPSSSSDPSLQIDRTMENAINHLDAVRTPVDHQKSCYPYDVLAALESIDGDEALLHSLFQIFLDTGPNLIHGMQEAIATKDRLRLHSEAHQLKGALLALNGHHQAKVVERLEAEALISSFPQLRHLMGEIEHDVKVLIAIFRSAIQAWGKQRILIQRKAKSEESGVSSE